RHDGGHLGLPHPVEAVHARVVELGVQVINQVADDWTHFTDRGAHPAEDRLHGPGEARSDVVADALEAGLKAVNLLVDPGEGPLALLDPLPDHGDCTSRNTCSS